MNVATAFIDDTAVTALGTRVPAASIDTGMNRGASNAPGIGIASGNPGLAEQLPNWTLLDQFGQARNAQRSQCLGGPGISAASQSDGTTGTQPAAVIRFVANPVNVGNQPDNDAPVVMGNGADLLVLATGWEDAA